MGEGAEREPQIREKNPASEFAVEWIDDLDDPRVRPYVGLKERDLTQEGNRFVAESETVVRRLLASGLEVQSVLLAEERMDRMLGAIPPGVRVMVLKRQLMNKVLGFKFHSGVMAVGVRPESPTVDQLASAWKGDDEVTLVVCPEIANTENLGSMVRISAAFGATAMILGERCCDPYYRQAVRVSMGTVFSMPILRSKDIVADLSALHERHGVERVATVLDEGAENLATASRGKRIALLFGAEGPGLAEEHVVLCDRRVTIPMQRGTDSLNVSVAAGVVLYHFTQYAERR